MADMHPAISSFFDQLTARMQESLSGVQAGSRISWSATKPEAREDLTWWSWSVSVDPQALVIAGASQETWNTLSRAYEAASEDFFGNGFGGIVQAIQQVAQGRFGADVQCETSGPLDGPPQQLSEKPIGADLEITFHEGALTVTVALSWELVEALGGEREAALEDEPVFPMGDASAYPVDRLLRIEVPVSVSLGRRQMRMKDVLALNSGSIVELEQQMGDRVEVRVNNCVIATGEMVAVDGNYGVRILEMASSQLGGRSAPNGAKNGRKV